MYASKIRINSPDQDAKAKWWQKPLQTSQVIVVSVAYGSQAVLGAEVEAIIESAQGIESDDGDFIYYRRWNLSLLDDGRSYENFAADGVDLYKNDGIYSGIFNLDNAGLFSGRYGVTVRVKGVDGRTFHVSFHYQYCSIFNKFM